MLFDELTSALDPELIGDLLKVIDLAPKGMTMVVVTHKMGVAQRTANRMLMLDYGLILEEGTPEQLFRDPKHERTKKFLNKIL